MTVIWGILVVVAAAFAWRVYEVSSTRARESNDEQE